MITEGWLANYLSSLPSLWHLLVGQFLGMEHGLFSFKRKQAFLSKEADSFNLIEVYSQVGQVFVV